MGERESEEKKERANHLLGNSLDTKRMSDGTLGALKMFQLIKSENRNEVSREKKDEKVEWIKAIRHTIQRGNKTSARHRRDALQFVKREIIIKICECREKPILN